MKRFLKIETELSQHKLKLGTLKQIFFPVLTDYLKIFF